LLTNIGPFLFGMSEQAGQSAAQQWDEQRPDLIGVEPSL
jgi:hypothetical protein